MGMRGLAVFLFCLLPAAAFAAPPPPLEVLFAQLKKAGSPEEAKPIEDRIAASSRNRAARASSS